MTEEPLTGEPFSVQDWHTALANLRHELRTPINAILGYTEMLLEDFSGEEPGQQAIHVDLKRIHIAGSQLLELVNEVLSQERIENGNLDDHPAQVSIELRSQLRSPVSAIIGYTELLIEEGQLGEGSSSAADLERIHSAAQSFLSLVEAARLAGSSGAAQSGPLETAGSTSDLFEAAVSTIRSQEENTQEPRPQAGVILVVDDSPINRDLLLRRMTREGHRVSLAENGRQALDLLRERPFDLVLLDILMPESNGYQVLQEIKTDPTLREIPVIMISAFDQVDSVAHCIEMGAEDYLPKPFNPVLLRARIDACLEKKRLRDKEVEYLHQASKITAAAAAVEANTFQPESLDEVARRTDELGGLARVFQRMASEVYQREQRLQEQVQALRIQVDEANKNRQVAEITETEYFQELRQKARRLRRRSPD